MEDPGIFKNLFKLAKKHHQHVKLALTDMKVCKKKDKPNHKCCRMSAMEYAAITGQNDVIQILAYFYKNPNEVKIGNNHAFLKNRIRSQHKYTGCFCDLGPNRLLH